MTVPQTVRTILSDASVVERHERNSKTERIPRYDQASANCRPACGIGALFRCAPAYRSAVFVQRMQPYVGDFCAALARMRKSYRLVRTEELDRVAGTVLHGGIVALAQPRLLPVLDPIRADEWARAAGRLLLLLDGVGNLHNLGAIARTAAFFGVSRIVLLDHPAQARPSDASYRVAEGGLEYVELYRGIRFAPMLKRLRRSYRVVAAAAERAVDCLSRFERTPPRPGPGQRGTRAAARHP